VIVTNASVAAGTYTDVNVTVGAASARSSTSGAAVGNCPAANPSAFAESLAESQPHHFTFQPESLVLTGDDTSG